MSLLDTQLKTTLSPHARAYLALLIGAICIGFSAIFTKWAGVEGPVAALYRVAIASAVLAVPFALQARRERNPQYMGDGFPRRAVLMTTLAGLFFALDLALWNTSLHLTSAANSTLLGNTSTIWVSIGALLIFHESLRKRFWSGMAIALLGAIIVVGRDVFEHPRLGLGDLLSVGSSFFYAGYLLATQRARQYVGTLPFMWLSSAVATVLLLVYVTLIGEPLTGYTLEQYLALAALGLISHVLGWLAINYALGHLPAAITSVALLLQPVITAIVAVPLLGEGLSILQVAGGLIVLLGIYTVVRR